MRPCTDPDTGGAGWDPTSARGRSAGGSAGSGPARHAAGTARRRCAQVRGQESAGQVSRPVPAALSRPPGHGLCEDGGITAVLSHSRPFRPRFLNSCIESPRCLMRYASFPPVVYLPLSACRYVPLGLCGAELGPTGRCLECIFIPTRLSALTYRRSANSGIRLSRRHHFYTFVNLFTTEKSVAPTGEVICIDKMLSRVL